MLRIAIVIGLMLIYYFRLSQIAGNKLKHNNADIADLSDRNRPTCLAEKFSELYDNEWTDAYDHVTKSRDQESTIAHLVDLLQVIQPTNPLGPAGRPTRRKGRKV